MRHYKVTIYQRSGNTYNGYTIYSGGFSVLEVHTYAEEVLLLDNGTLVFVDGDYNKVLGFAPGQWISFEEIIENETE